MPETKRREYRLTTQEILKLTQAMQNPTLFNSAGQPVQTAYERCIEVWKIIAKDRGVNWKTILPRADKDPEYFTAEPLTQVEETDYDSSNVH